MTPTTSLGPVSKLITMNPGDAGETNATTMDFKLSKTSTFASKEKPDPGAVPCRSFLIL
jgi:hypothetical protein